MEMEVMIPLPAVEFNFDSTSTSPLVSAPSSPQRFGGSIFFSAPTSPTRVSSFFHEPSFKNPTPSAATTIPFNWEEKPGTPKRQHYPAQDTPPGGENEDVDFAFNFSAQSEASPSLTADELFDGGMIKPLKPPPRLQLPHSIASSDSPKSPKRFFRDALSPRHKKKEFDPFAEAIKQTVGENTQKQHEISARGRERNSKDSTARRKVSRSLSPFRVSDILFDDEANQHSSRDSSSNSWYTRWRLSDLLLFRSASEGSATTSKDSFKKYAALKKSHCEDVKNSSFRSTDSGCSVGSSSGGGGSGRSRRRVSAHELHYTANRAVAEEMRRKTFLPYRRGLLSCLGFKPDDAFHDLSKGFSLLRRR